MANAETKQRSDAGVVGLVTFGAVVAGRLVLTLRRSGNANGEAMRFAVWLGLLGWWLQGFMEFGLYMPALAWPGFALTGWLLATAKRFDKPGPTAKFCRRDENPLHQRSQPESVGQAVAGSLCPNNIEGK